MPAQIRVGDNCISEDTLIPLLNGKTIKICELVSYVGEYLYSLDVRTKKVVPGKIEKVWKVGEEECIRLHLDNGLYLDCTKDHKVLLRKGNYKKAGKLKIGDSLMPLYREMDYYKSQRGYEVVHHPNGTSQKTHKMVYDWKYGNDIVDKNVCHHKNFDIHNNNPSNILGCTPKDHWHYHSDNKSKQMKFLASEGRHPWQSEKVRKMNQERMKSNNPMKDPDVQRRKVQTERERYGGTIVERMNLTDNVMKYEHVKRKMVETRRSHPLGYHQGKNPWLSEKVKEANSKRMKASNPMKSEEVKNRIREKTAVKYGFSSNEEFKNFICQKFTTEKLSIKKISLIVGCDKSTIQKRLPNNHKIVNIEYVGLKDVWDITVSNYHNFAIGAGIFISNCSGHECWIPYPAEDGSPNIIVNGREAMRVTDPYMTHPCPGQPPCSRTAKDGSPNVYYNNLRAHRVGDALTDRAYGAQGSPNVFINDGTVSPRLVTENNDFIVTETGDRIKTKWTTYD